MGIDKIVVLRVPPSVMERFAPAEERAPDGWMALLGEGGGPFAARAIEDGVLVMPFASFEGKDELALHLRLLLGAVVDAHDDARGIHVLSHEVAAAHQRYDDLVAGDAGAWIAKVPAHDERLPRGSGWSFADAARTFSTPGTRKRVEAEPTERTESQQTKTPEPEDPLEKAENKFGQIFTAREDRGTLRRTLSAALDHSLEASALGTMLAPRPNESDLGKDEHALAGSLKRGLTSSPDAMNALEGILRKAVDEGLKDDGGSEGSTGKEPDAEAGGGSA